MADKASRPARGASILNPVLAALAAGALGFLVFAMPEGVFSDIIAGSGLPAYLPAAEPPLGMKARAAVIATVALLVFAFVLLLLRGIDRLSAGPAAAGATPAKPDSDAPRLRQADSHPDAPAPRPILAGRDLGGFAAADEYDYPPDADDEMFADLPAQPLPGFLVAGRTEPVAEDRIDEEIPSEEPFETAGLAEPEPEHEADGQSDVESGQAEEEPLVLDTLADDRSVEALVSQLPEADECSDNSITSLMRRLETGLVRREEEAGPAEEQSSAPPSWLAPQPEEAEAEEAEAEGFDRADDSEPYRSEEPSPPPAWLAPQAEAGQYDEIEAHRAGEAEPVRFTPAYPEVDEFGEPRRQPARAEEPQFAPLGAAHRDPSGASKVQALPPQPVQSAPAEVEAPAEMSIGRRLRSAIADMDRIASSGGA